MFKSEQELYFIFVGMGVDHHAQIFGSVEGASIVKVQFKYVYNEELSVVVMPLKSGGTWTLAAKNMLLFESLEDAEREMVILKMKGTIDSPSPRRFVAKWTVEWNHSIDL